MPPARLMSSIAMSAPFFISSPCRAQGPDIGAIIATLTSFACDHAGPAPSASPAPAKAASERPDERSSLHSHLSFLL